MSFGGDVARFRDKTMAKAKAIHDGCADLAFTSIVEGSPVTGAPGQPVKTGNLRASWQNVVVDPLTRLIATNVIYAPQIEDGTRNGRALMLRSPVGGFHSVKLTVAGWRRIVETVTSEVSRG